MLPEQIIPQQPSEDDLARATVLVLALEAACDLGEQSPAALLELRQLTGNPRIKTEDYHEISGAMSHRAAALLAFYPTPQKIDGLTYENFLAISKAMKERLVADDFDYWFGLFSVNCRNANAGDLMFYPRQEWIDRLISDGEIDPTTTPMSFDPSAEQLAQEGWRTDAETQ